MLCEESDGRLQGDATAARHAPPRPELQEAPLHASRERPMEQSMTRRVLLARQAPAMANQRAPILAPMCLTVRCPQVRRSAQQSLQPPALAPERLQEPAFVAKASDSEPQSQTRPSSARCP